MVNPIRIFQLTVLLWACEVFGKDVSSKIVETRNGPVQGIIKKARDGSPFVAFMGLRYADPPQRFEPPDSLTEVWKYTKVADAPGSHCSQVGMTGDATGSEDCLFLNVYVPKSYLEAEIDSKAKLPVMVWIHGGGFTSGDGTTYGPDYFMDNEDIILITINYRLGILGFLNTEDDVVVGNNGLRDQVMALRWVQENIVAFNGDPSQVTVFGNSAGSASIHFLLMSPLSKGLYQNAILQSGTFSFWSYTPNPLETAIKFAEYLKCPALSGSEDEEDLSSVEIRKCLEGKSVKELIAAQEAFWPRWPLFPSLTRFLPASKESNINPFFENHPGVIYGKHMNYTNKVRVMIGTTKDEGSTLFGSFILSNNQSIEDINQKWEEIAPKTLFIDNYFPSDMLPVVSKKIRDFYFGKGINAKISHETSKKLCDMYGDPLFLVPAMLAADEMARNGMTVYPYVFLYEGSWNIRKAFGLVDLPGVIGHAEELQYQFTHDFLSHPLEPNSDEEDFSKSFIRLWKTFAKEGNPGTEWEPGHDLTWPQIEPHPQQPKDIIMFNRLSISNEPSVVKLDFGNRIRFWMMLIREFGINPPPDKKPYKWENHKAQKTEL